MNTIGSQLVGGGTMILSTPNAAHLASRLKFLFGTPVTTSHAHMYWNPSEFRDHIKEYTLGELKDVVEWSGFDIEEQTAINQYARMELNAAREESRYLYASVIQSYLVISSLRDSFKDNQFVKARKPADWAPVEPSVEKFAEEYTKLREFNLDDLSDEEIRETMASR
jgi:hypothetical protein